jgi:hypothetical protein
VFKNQLSRQTGSRNLTTFFVTFFSATIDGRNLIFGHKLHIGTHIVGSVFGPIRFLLPVCRLCWFLCTLNIYAHFSAHFSQQLLMAETYMFNVYKNQLSRQTGSRNLTGPKTLPTIWVPIWSLWQNIRFLPSTVTEKNATKNILDGRKEVKQYTPYPFGLHWCSFIYFCGQFVYHFPN